MNMKVFHDSTSFNPRVWSPRLVCCMWKQLLSSTPEPFPPASHLLWFTPHPVPDHVAISEPAWKQKEENAQNPRFGFSSMSGNLQNSLQKKNSEHIFIYLCIYLPIIYLSIYFEIDQYLPFGDIVYLPLLIRRLRACLHRVGWLG